MKPLRIAGAIAYGLILMLVLVVLPEYTPGVLESFAPSMHITSIITYFFNAYTLALGAVLATVSALGIALSQGTRKGVIKAAQGVIGMLYFLYIMHFGAITITTNAHGFPVSISLVFTIGLVLIELSLLLTVVEGLIVALRR